jgi:predicted ATPase/signal transduction histidine kinase/tRNA A-37 threonylcarbamoyl transferase component Bud32
MITVPGYEVTQKLYESTKSLVCRGLRTSDQVPVILKVLKQDYPSSDELRRYKQEYQIIRKLNQGNDDQAESNPVSSISSGVSPGVITAYALEAYQRGLVIVLEDFGALSLKQLITERQINGEIERSLAIAQFLQIAIKITDSLSHIHAANIIHKDINPSNIVFNPETNCLKIIDFGISSEVIQENYAINHPNVLEGTLAYISPEQTGRMNRILDYRTDFYSLGVTFYELLTSRLPFDSSDAMELVHAHLAKQPLPPNRINPEIPKPVSNIVLKLMSKNAEERYQSTLGLKADLENCLAQWRSSGTITEFAIATQDVSNKFQIPQKLYGRDAETQILLKTLERISNGNNAESEIILISGYAGIGKSSLAQELLKPITETHGYLIAGKFDQFQRLPYSAVANAFQGLMRQLLAEPEAQLQAWRSKILTGLGANGQIIIDFIPDLELIVGKQPSPIDVGAAASQSRFNHVWQSFIRLFCSSDRPLAIFLDDLQWADSASLKLIELIVTDRETQNLLLIGAYREVEQTHPLLAMVAKLSATVARINQIWLPPLELDAVRQLIAETLRTDAANISSLAALVMRKTSGNPFFVNEFLKTLHAEDLLSFDFERAVWRWDIAQIEAQGITENVVEMAIAKIRKLPESTQRIVRLASCIGTNFDIDTLAMICESSPHQIYADLLIALRSGLLLTATELDDRLLIRDYKFQHDRIQQAAYNSITAADKKQLHLKIGQLLLQSTAPELIETRVFELVGHLNMGLELIVDQDRKDELAQLNLTAAQRAKSSVAYDMAWQYLEIARGLLSADSWRRNYDLTLSIYVGLTEAAFLCNDFAQMGLWAEIVLQQAIELLDRVKIYQIKIQASIAHNQMFEAIAIALEALHSLGIDLPQHPSQSDVSQQELQTQLVLSQKSVEDLLNLPLMTDPHKLAAMQTIALVCTPTYFKAPQLWQLMVFQKVQISLQYGNAPGSAFGYADYGMVLCGVAENFDLGYEFAQLASNLLPCLDAKEFVPKTLLLINLYLRHWKEHLRETLNPLLETYELGLETGDIDYATNAIAFYFYHAFLVGKELTALAQELAGYQDAIAQFNRSRAINMMNIYRQAILNLLGQSEHPCDLIGESYNEVESLPLHLANHNKSTVFHVYLNKLILHYLFHDYAQAVQDGTTLKQLLSEGAVGMLVVPQVYFYDSLANLAIYSHSSELEQQQILSAVAANQQKMQVWATHAPMNYLHKFHLVEAERYRILGQISAAMDAYDRAIELANQHGYINEEAIAHELAAKFYLAIGKAKIARIYMQDAYYAYQQWGAIAKIGDLERLYPELLEGFSPAKATQVNLPSSQSDPSSSSGYLDLAAVLKAAHTISVVMMLEELLMKLMRILLENAGAEKGYLILVAEDKLLVEAEGFADREHIAVLRSVPIEEFSDRLSLAIINYVARTLDSVVLNDATQNHIFSQDAYIAAYRPMSILCTPLLNQGKLSGILYVENNLAHDVFTTERLELLRILSAQAAISIDNARLYQNLAELNQSLEIRVQERTVELSQANQRLLDNEQQVLKSLAMERELNLIKSNFISMVSHEFRNPMMTISGCVRSLQNPKRQLDEDRKIEYFKLIQEAIADMVHLLDEVLLLGRTEAGRLNYEPKLIDLEQFCLELTEAQNLSTKEAQTITFTYQGNCHEAGMDPTLLRYIFSNLLSNAIKYSPPGSQIRFDLACSQGMATFRVKDRGIGIPQSDRQRLFETFHRASNVGQVQGTGLGLAIVKKCVSLHEGKIELESEVNVGTTVTVMLPIRPQSAIS